MRVWQRGETACPLVACAHEFLQVGAQNQVYNMRPDQDAGLAVHCEGGAGVVGLLSGIWTLRSVTPVGNS